MENHELRFNKKFIHLLILQQERLGKRKQAGTSGFRSVGEILGSDKYIQHFKRGK